MKTQGAWTRLSREQRTEIDRIAKRMNTTRSGALRYALEAFLRKPSHNIQKASGFIVWTRLTDEDVRLIDVLRDGTDITRVDVIARAAQDLIAQFQQ